MEIAVNEARKDLKMNYLIIIFGLKIIGLIGAILNTAGFIGFFAFAETLGPHKWQLLLIGFVLIGLSEGLSYWLTRRHLAHAETSQEDKDD